MKKKKNIKSLPEKHLEIDLSIKLTAKDIECINTGLYPSGMDSRWNIYRENDLIYFHRSWTGSCIYVCQLEGDSITRIKVNNESSEYECASIEDEKESFRQILKSFFDGKL